MFKLLELVMLLLAVQNHYVVDIEETKGTVAREQAINARDRV
jgi:hypothetical protein